MMGISVQQSMHSRRPHLLVIIAIREEINVITSKCGLASVLSPAVNGGAHYFCLLYYITIYSL